MLSFDAANIEIVYSYLFYFIYRNISFDDHHCLETKSTESTMDPLFGTRATQVSYAVITSLLVFSHCFVVVSDQGGTEKRDEFHVRVGCQRANGDLQPARAMVRQPCLLCEVGEEQQPGIIVQRNYRPSLGDRHEGGKTRV